MHKRLISCALLAYEFLKENLTVNQTLENKQSLRDKVKCYALLSYTALRKANLRVNDRSMYRHPDIAKQVAKQFTILSLRA